MDMVIQHFSHQHPLKLVNFQPETTNAFTCAGCKLEASGWFYFCSTCNYCLHKTCSYMPQNKDHGVDPKHTLVLLSSPVYAVGSFKCNACGKLGTGFCYRCKDCQLDIHTLCIYKPSSVNVNSHHHTLELCLKPPYGRKKFQCDICKKSGSNHWLYRCGACNYDVHMNCAMSNQLQPATDIQQTPILHPTDSDISTLPICHNAVVSTDPQPVAEIRQTQEEKLHHGNSANFHVQPIATIQVQRTHQGELTDIANRYAQAVTGIEQTQQHPKLLMSRSFPPRFPKYTTDLPSSGAMSISERQIYDKKESFDSRMSDAFLIRNVTHLEEQRNRKETSNESRSMPGIGNQSNKSENGRSDCSCWSNLFQS